MILQALFRKAGLAFGDDEPEAGAPSVMEQDRGGNDSALARLFAEAGFDREPEPEFPPERSAAETVRQSGKLLARGAGAEGFYAGVEGAARLLSSVPETVAGVFEALGTARDKYQGLSPEDIATRKAARAAQTAERLRDIETESPVVSEARRQVRGYADATKDVRQQIREALPVDADFAASLPGQIMQGLGQAAGTLPTFAVPGAGPGMVLGQLYQQAFDDAKGHGADDTAAHGAGVKNLPAAALEYAADRLIIGKVLKPLRGKVSVGQLARDIMAAGVVEGGTEGAQQGWQNYVARELAGYDPERRLDDQVLNSILVGAIVGGTVTGAGSLASQAAGRGQVSEVPAQEMPAEPTAAPGRGVPVPAGTEFLYEQDGQSYYQIPDAESARGSRTVDLPTLEQEGFDTASLPAESAQPPALVAAVSAGQPALDLTPPDTPGHVEGAWKRAIKFGRLFYEGSADVLRRAGRNKLAGAVDQHVDLTERNLAQAWGYVKPAVENFTGLKGAINGAKRDQAAREFAAYYRARENGRKAEAAKTLATASAPARSLIEATERLFTFTGAQNDRLGVKVLDRETGAWRPAANMGRDYWPRVMNEETAAVLRDPSSNPARWEQMKQELVENGNIETQAEADQFLRESHARESADDFMANMELARTGKLPESWYEYDPLKVLPRFVSKWSERSAQIEAFGQKAGEGGKDAFDRELERTPDPTTRNYIEATREHAYRVRHGDPALRKLLGNVTSATAGLFLGNPYSAARNLFGGVAQTANQFGVVRSLKALGRVWNGIADAEVAGAVKADVADMLFAGEDSPGVRLAVNVALKLGGFSPAENFVRAHSYLTAKAYLRDAIATAHRKPTGPRALQDRAFMRRLGFDHAALVKENLKGPLTDSFLRGSVREGQGGYRYNQVPLFVDSPLGRFFFQFARWGTQAARFHARNTFRPAVFGELVKVNEGGKVVERRVRTLLPLLRSPLVAMGAGAATLALREAVLGIERQDAGWDEIWRTKEEDERRAFSLALSRTLNDVIFAGTFGAISDYGALLKDAATRSRFRNPLQPPAASIVQSAVELAYKLTQQGRLSRDDYERFFGSVLSGYRVGNKMVLNFADKVDADWDRARLERADRDRLFTRRAGSRFADETGLEDNPYQPGALPNVNERTPLFSEIEEALLLGDAFKARELADEYLAGLVPAKAKAAQRGLMASIRGRQPVRPGGSTGAELQQAFMDWAGRRLSEAEFRRIADVQGRFIETGVAAQLLPDSSLARWRDVLSRAMLTSLVTPRVEIRTVPAARTPTRNGARAMAAPKMDPDE